MRTRRWYSFAATTAVATITLAVSIPALVLPRLVSAFEQDPQAMVHGQWWRLLTPMLIQGSGLWQLIFNLLGTVMVGIVVERHYGWWRWLVVYIASGVAAILLTSLWFPHTTDSGSSAAVAGLIGALVVSMLLTSAPPSWPSMLYGVFFAVYLTAFALGGPVVGAVVGTIVIPVFVFTRMYAGSRVMCIGTVAVIVLATVTMLILGEAHGVGLAVGMITSLLLRPRHEPVR